MGAGSRRDRGRVWWNVMINERSIPDAGQPGMPSKLVSLSGDASAKPKPRLKKDWFIGGLVSLLVVAAVAATWWALDERSTVRHVTAPVAKGAVIRTVTATGTVNPELTIIVGAAVSGIIKELNCDYNTKVKKGQICAKIDPRPYQSIVDRTRQIWRLLKRNSKRTRPTLPTPSSRSAVLPPSCQLMLSPRTPMTAPRAPTIRRWRRSRSTKQPFSNVRLR